MGGGSICGNWLGFCETSIKDAQLRLCQLEYYLSPQIIYGSEKALMRGISSNLYKYKHSLRFERCCSLLVVYSYVAVSQLCYVSLI